MGDEFKRTHAHGHACSLPLIVAWVITLGTMASWAQYQRPKIIEAFFVFYQPVALMVLMLWLWAVVVRFFETYAVRYEVCFAKEHHRFLLSWQALASLAATFTTILTASGCLYMFFAAHNMLHLASYQPGLLYLACVLVLVSPFDWIYDSFYSSQRWFFLVTLKRVVLPFQAVAFTDFLLADVLTSLAKPLSDLGLAVCHLVSEQPIRTALHYGLDTDFCNNHSLLIPAVLILPYLWRFIQCLIVLRTATDNNQAWNALKYTTAWPVIILSFVKYFVDLEDWKAVWKPLWIVSAVVNTAFSFYWDVEKDWDIGLFHGGRPLLRTDVRMFQRDELYMVLIGVNLVLRVAWTYKLSAHLRHMRWFVFIMALLEIVRRFLWMFVRIENELRKIHSRQPDLGELIHTGHGNPKAAALEADSAKLVNVEQTIEVIEHQTETRDGER